MLAGTVALAAGVGAAAGAAGFAGAAKLTGPPPPSQAHLVHPPAKGYTPAGEVKSLKDAAARLRASLRTLSENVNALRANVEASGRASSAASAKLDEQMGKLREQLAKLHESAEFADRKASARQAAAAPQHMPTTLERAAAALERADRRPDAGAPAPAVTGSIPTPSPRPAEIASARPNIVDGWALRRVYDGFALVEGRQGTFEVEPGDMIRGVGRVQDIRRRDGRWIVVTSGGVIVPR
jgi:hypothetical protein